MGPAAQRPRHVGALAAIAEVRPQELRLALLLGLNIFLVLTAQYVLKPVRDAFIIALPGGAEHKSYATSGLVVLMLLIVPAYGAVAGRVARNHLLVGTTVMCMAAMALFYGLSGVPWLRPWLAVPLYLFVGIFGMMAVAQFWAFAADLTSEEQGARLFVLIALGQSLGALAGSGVATLLVAPPAGWPAPALEVRQLLLVGIACLAPTLALVQAAHAAAPEGDPTRPAEAPGARATRPRDVARMILSSRYLVLLSLLHAIFTLVRTNGDYILSATVAGAAPDAGLTLDGLDRTAWIAHFYGTFYMWVSGLGLLLQLLVVSRVVRYGGVRAALLSLPLIALGGAGLTAALPVLLIVAVGAALENATDYSLHNTVRQILWLPTTRDAKYVAKQAIDTFFVRFGDAASALLVYVGVHAFGWAVRGFAVANLCLALAWMALAARVIQENRRLSRAHADVELAPQRVASS